MTQGDPNKWNMPGWRIEQKYSTKVLIGNWQEERLKFLKGDSKANSRSTNRMDFRNFGNHRPDVIIRRKAQFNSGGVGKDFLFNHHGNKYSKNMISWYDEHYNKRERDEENKLPALRNWDSHTLSWRPEKTDHPIQGEPTNFGLLKSRQGDWRTQIASESDESFNTTYSASYMPVPSSARVRIRFATSRDVSTPLHRQNKINKDIHYRGTQKYLSPETIGSPMGLAFQAAPMSQSIVY